MRRREVVGLFGLMASEVSPCSLGSIASEPTRGAADTSWQGAHDGAKLLTLWQPEGSERGGLFQRHTPSDSVPPAEPCPLRMLKSLRSLKVTAWQ